MTIPYEPSIICATGSDDAEMAFEDISDIDCKNYVIVAESIQQTLTELFEQPRYFNRHNSKYAVITGGGMDEVHHRHSPDC